MGQMGQDFANIEMVTDLTNLLPQQQRQTCSVALHKRIYNDYADASSYSKSDQAQIEKCLSQMRHANAVDKASSREVRTALQEMILGRFISTTRNVWSADVLQAKSEDDRIGLRVRQCKRVGLDG